MVQQIPLPHFYQETATKCFYQKADADTDDPPFF